MPDYFKQRIGMFGKAPAPQAKKLASQRSVGANSNMFDYTGAKQPLGGANLRSSQAGPYVKPNAETPAPASSDKQPFDWNRMSYILGGIGKAAMGPYQDRWQAQAFQHSV